MLKKLGIASLVLSSSLFAGSYIGMDFGMAKNDTTHSTSGLLGVGDTTKSNDYTDISLVFGTGDNGGVKIQGRINFVSYDEEIYVDGDSFLEIGVDIIKEFDIGNNLYPFVKAGLGGDYMSVDEDVYDQSIAVGFELNAGAGVNYMATDKVGIIFGVDYKYRKWQDTEVTTIGGTNVLTISTDDSGFEPFLGVRYSF